jgi:GntR family transcriptional regulator
VTKRERVEHDAPVPPSRQLADILRREILSGALPPRGRLPSILRLAEEHGVSTSTVQKSLRILKSEGRVESVPGYGTFVVGRRRSN